MRTRLAVAVALALGLAAPAHGGVLASQAKVPRPTEGGEYAYAAPEAPPYASAHVVVHYVTEGPDAPALDDIDVDGIPDYVEAIGTAADVALAFYRARGFRAPAPDAAGPDSRPDIYVKQLPARIHGVAFTPGGLTKDSFTLVSRSLETREDKPTASLQVTVAHELFHIVQYAYMGERRIPGWVAEGTAMAMPLFVFPKIADGTTVEHLAAWLTQPWLPIHDERSECGRCYGSAWWWAWLAHRDARFVPAYLERLAAARRTGFGLDALAWTLKKRGHGSLARAYARFSLDMARADLPLGVPYRVDPNLRLRMTGTLGISPLSAQYIPVKVSRSASKLVVVIAHSAGWIPEVRLLLGGPKGRVLSGRELPSKRTLVLRATFRTAAERKRAVLLVSGAVTTVERYRLLARAYARGPALPPFIAVPGKLP